MALIAAMVLVVAHLLRGYGQVSSFLDPQQYFSLDAAGTILFDTTWGHGWIAQFVAASLCIPLALFARRRVLAVRGSDSRTSGSPIAV